jgi:hypothetical protein
MREYQRILDTIHDREDECDHRSRNKKVAQDKYWSKLYFERQAHHYYNMVFSGNSNGFYKILQGSSYTSKKRIKPILFSRQLIIL